MYKHFIHGFHRYNATSGVNVLKLSINKGATTSYSSHIIPQFVNMYPYLKRNIYTLPELNSCHDSQSPASVRRGMSQFRTLVCDTNSVPDLNSFPLLKKKISRHSVNSARSDQVNSAPVSVNLATAFQKMSVLLIF